MDHVRPAAGIPPGLTLGMPRGGLRPGRSSPFMSTGLGLNPENSPQGTILAGETAVMIEGRAKGQEKAGEANKLNIRFAHG